jgi:hypothetical protein
LAGKQSTFGGIGSKKMRTKVVSTAALLLAGLFVVGLSTPASAGSAFTGGKSCPAGSFAYTQGTIGQGNTITHSQSVGGSWWNSPLGANTTAVALRTTWQYSKTNLSFYNSYLTTGGANPTSAAAACA